MTVPACTWVSSKEITYGPAKRASNTVSTGTPSDSASRTGNSAAGDHIIAIVARVSA